MIPYWLLFALWTTGALQAERHRGQNQRQLLFILGLTVVTLMIGLRYQVGGDWGAYQRSYNTIFFLSFRDSLSVTDIGYSTINWLSAQADLGVVFVNLVCAAIFMVGFGYICWHQPNPSLAVLVAVPYFIIVVAMGYTRQAAAIGLICLAVQTASQDRLWRLVFLIGLASLMHKTAVLMLPVALYPYFRRNLLLSAVGMTLFVALFVLVLRDSSDRLMANYVNSEYDSQGALVRVVMNVLAASIFLSLRKRIELPPIQKSFWTICAILSFLSLAALFSASASSGIDRISLYLIPLQAVTYSQLPYILGKDKRKALPSVLISVVSYSFAVQFVWLNYADNARYWVPYGMAFTPAGGVP